MKAYVIALINVHDQETYDRYRSQVMPTISAFEGRFMVRAGRFSVLEGEWPHERTVVLEFPDRERAEAWYRSPGYQAILPLRRGASAGNLIIVEGAE